jgi:hypothetical protein
MAKSFEARRRKPEASKTDLGPPIGVLRRKGCPPRGGIRRYAGKYRAVIDWGRLQMNRSAKDGITITRAEREKGRVDAAFQALRNDKNVIVIAR